MDERRRQDWSSFLTVFQDQRISASWRSLIKGEFRPQNLARGNCHVCCRRASLGRDFLTSRSWAIGLPCSRLCAHRGDPETSAKWSPHRHPLGKPLQWADHQRSVRFPAALDRRLSTQSNLCPRAPSKLQLLGWRRIGLQRRKYFDGLETRAAWHHRSLPLSLAGLHTGWCHRHHTIVARVKLCLRCRVPQLTLRDTNLPV